MSDAPCRRLPPTRIDRLVLDIPGPRRRPRACARLEVAEGLAAAGPAHGGHAGERATVGVRLDTFGRYAL